MGMVKKGQAKILTVVLIILIVVVAMAILWNVVVPLIQEKSESVEFGQFNIGLEIREVIVFESGVSIISVNRKSGGGELDGLKFVFYDAEGNSITRDEGGINELETKTYSFSAIDESGFGAIARVGVAPIINNDLGMVVESEPESVLSVPSSVVSWWKFDDLNDFVGGNTCNVLEGGISNGVLNGKVDCNSAGLDLTENMAISFWVKGDNGGEIISKGAGYTVSIDENDKINFVSGTKSGVSDYELIDDWNHVVISISFATPQVYVNNQRNILDGFVKISFNAGDERLIFNGQIDEVMIFNNSLDSTQVRGIYNTQKKE